MANILIIEDEAALAKNIARYFQAKGHQVDVAGTGREGVALAAAQTLMSSSSIFSCLAWMGWR